MRKLLVTFSLLVMGPLAYGAACIINLVPPTASNQICQDTANQMNFIDPVAGQVTLSTLVTPVNFSPTGSITAGGSITSGTTLKVGTFFVPTSSVPIINALSQQIVPVTSYVDLAPNAIAAYGQLTGTPTISTSSVLGQSVPFADGTLLIVQSTSTTAVELQDNGSLAGSELFLSGPLGGTVPFVIVSSSKTAEFIYNATEKGWNYIGR